MIWSYAGPISGVVNVASTYRPFILGSGVRSCRMQNPGSGMCTCTQSDPLGHHMCLCTHTGCTWVRVEGVVQLLYWKDNLAKTAVRMLIKLFYEHWRVCWLKRGSRWFARGRQVAHSPYFFITSFKYSWAWLRALSHAEVRNFLESFSKLVEQRVAIKV